MLWPLVNLSESFRIKICSSILKASNVFETTLSLAIHTQLLEQVFEFQNHLKPQKDLLFFFIKPEAFPDRLVLASIAIQESRHEISK